HEIACHGYNHRLVYELTEHEFMQDITNAKKIIEAITEGTVIGYRAPSWSVCRYRTPWFWNVLRKTGFLYDASLFPFKTFLYGDNHNRPYFHAIRVDDGGKIYEIPGSVSIFCGLRIPFGGGFYFRFWPSWVIRFFIKRLNAQKQPAVIYLHPREVDIEQPRLKLNLRDYFIMYHNIHQADQKLEKILNRFTFTDIRHVYAELFNKN
ncbi:MAG: polysaccharide deacetylase family protein, partial [candidate division WOR-3 bacterium]